MQEGGGIYKIRTRLLSLRGVNSMMSLERMDNSTARSMESTVAIFHESLAIPILLRFYQPIVKFSLNVRTLVLKNNN